MKTKLTATQIGKTRNALFRIIGLESYGEVDQCVIDLIPKELILNPKELWALACCLQDQFGYARSITKVTMEDALRFVASLSLPKAKLTQRRRAISAGMDALMHKHYRRTFNPRFFSMSAAKLQIQKERLHLQPYTDANNVSIINKGGELQRLSNSRRSALGLPYKTMTTSKYTGNCFTVEVEFLANTDSTLVIAGANQVFARMTNANVHFKGDASVRETGPQHTRAAHQEATISVMWGQYKNLYETCKAMADAGATVNTTCGLHVHLDSRHLSRHKETGRRVRLKKALPWLFELVPPSRKNNKYCWDNNSPLPPEQRRYLAISPTSYDAHGSTEIRLGAGSLDADKMLNWAMLLKFLADSRLSYPTFEKFLDSRAPHHIKVWAVLRRNKFLPALGNTTEGSEVNV